MMRLGAVAATAFAMLNLGALPAAAQDCPADQWRSGPTCCPRGSFFDRDRGACVAKARAGCSAGDLHLCEVTGDHFAASHEPVDRKLGAHYYRHACGEGGVRACVKLGRMERAASSATARARGRHHFERACDAGQLEGCAALAEVWLEEETEAYWPDALHRLALACDASLGRACGVLARALAVSREASSQVDSAEACAAAQKGCALHAPFACAALADLAAAGTCTAQRPPVTLADEACKAGEPEGCRVQGELLLKQLASPDAAVPAQAGQVSRQARALLASACEAYDRRACTVLGELLERGQHGDQDIGQAIVRYKQACRLQSADGCLAFATLQARQDIPGKYRATFSAFEAACRLGSARHCETYAEHALEGRGIRRSRRWARRALTRACDLGSGSACATLGDLAGYSARDAGLPGYASARAPLTRACQAGLPAACVKAGLLAIHAGGAEGMDEARASFKRACDADDDTACALLGRQLLLGHGGPSDRPRALALLAKSCGERDMLACSAVMSALLPKDSRKGCESLAPDAMYPHPYAEYPLPPRFRAPGTH